MSSGVAAKDVSFAPAAGEVFAGHYRVERILGTGGMGVVLAATDERTGESVAIKLLRAAEERRSVERFFREARAMSSLSTEHVVRVVEAGTAETRPYLVMERLDGQDFAEQARGGRKLPMRDVVDAAIQACEALSHAHRAGIVHRDLKPSNLFLHTPASGGRAVVKLLDFGISKVKSKEEWEMTLTATNDGGVLGSPPYMSPEQVRDPKKVDARSDVWALGIVMYKLLAGKLPFDGDSVGEVFARVLERPYPPLRAWGGVDVPPELDAIVGKCLAKDRRDRFQHTGELAQALAPFASPEWAALARRVAARLADDPPTVDEPGGAGGAGAPTSEPRTLTLEESQPGLAGIPTPVVATPFEMTPPGLGSQTPGSGAPVYVPTSPPAGPGVSATFGPAVIDPRLRAEVPPNAAGAPSRAAALGVLLAAAVLVVAVALGLGIRKKGSERTAEARPAAVVSAPLVAPSTAATASAAPPTSAAPVAPMASVAPPVATATATATTSPARPKGGGRRPVGTGPSSPSGGGAATTAPPATARPELHPNPYGS